MHIAGSPACLSPSYSHAVREQASKPMRSSGRPRSLQSRYQRVRLAGRSKLFHDAARLIDHADRGLFQRHIQSSEVFHGCSFPMLVAVRQPTTPIIPMEQPLLSPSLRPQSPHLAQKSPRQSLSATTASETDSGRSALVCPKIPSAGWRRMDSRLLLLWSDVAQRRRLSCGNCLRCANEGSRLPKQGVCFASSSDSAVGRPGGAKEHAVAQIGGYLNLNPAVGWAFRCVTVGWTTEDCGSGGVEANGRSELPAMQVMSQRFAEDAIPPPERVQLLRTLPQSSHEAGDT